MMGLQDDPRAKHGHNLQQWQELVHSEPDGGLQTTQRSVSHRSRSARARNDGTPASAVIAIPLWRPSRLARVLSHAQFGGSVLVRDSQAAKSTSDVRQCLKS